jgi:hypothetical protein
VQVAIGHKYDNCVKRKCIAPKRCLYIIQCCQRHGGFAAKWQAFVIVIIYIGKYGRPRVTGKNAEITLHNLSEPGIIRVIHAAIKYLQGPLTKSLKAAADSDLINIRDEMTGQLNQLLYLFTLH